MYQAYCIYWPSQKFEITVNLKAVNQDRQGERIESHARIHYVKLLIVASPLLDAGL